LILRENCHDVDGRGEKKGEDENERGKNVIVLDEKISS